jgi:hypothetical protein
MVEFGALLVVSLDSRQPKTVSGMANACCNAAFTLTCQSKITNAHEIRHQAHHATAWGALPARMDALLR